MFRKLIAICLAATFLAGSSFAGEDDGHHHPEPNPGDPNLVVASEGEAIIQVNGVVCSFCAHGLEKSLAKLEALDTSVHRNGVLVDVEAQRVTLALKPDQRIPFRDIVGRIRKAGYDPVRFHVRVSGDLAAEGDPAILVGATPPQRFAVPPHPESGAVNLQVRVEVAALEAAAVESPVPGTIDAPR